MKLPFRIDKRGKYVRYAWMNEKTYHSIKKILPADKMHIATSKPLCKAFLLEYLIKQEEQAKSRDRLTSQITFENYTKNWYIPGKCSWLKRQESKGKTFKRATITSKRGHLVNYAWPAFGDQPINRITAVDIENMLASHERASQTMQHIIYSIAAPFREMKREGLIEKDPIEYVDPIKIKHEPKDILTPEEIKKLWPIDEKEMIDVWREYRVAVFFFLTITSGLRRGEICALQWKHIDFDLGAIFLLQNVDSDRAISTPKNTEIRGSILPKRTINMLRQWHRETPYPEPDDFIFSIYFRGNPPDGATLGYKLKPALERAGINTENKNLSLHSLRHTYNTIMEPLLSRRALQFMIGHKSDKMTDHYNHATIEDKLQQLLPERSKIDSAWE